MIQLNLTVKQALAVYGLIGCVRIGETGSRNIDDVELMLADSLSFEIRSDIWTSMTAYHDEGVNVDQWDEFIGVAVDKYGS